MLELVSINCCGIEVPSDSPYARGKKAVRWMCDSCGCTGRESDEATWSCVCRCHDGWKLGQDGQRYRSEVDSRSSLVTSGSGVLSGGSADVVGSELQFGDDVFGGMNWDQP